MPKVEFKCDFCSKDYMAYKCQSTSDKHFCSISCQTKGRTKRVKTLISYNCKQCNINCERRKGTSGKLEFCSIQCMAIWRGQLMSGSNHPNWKGKEKNRPWATKKWRKSILERDNYTCVKCASKNNLQAHHINDWSKNITNRLDISNGMTLCITCHANEHKNIKSFILGGQKWKIKNS